MLGFLIATLHEHKHCKRRFFLLFGEKKWNHFEKCFSEHTYIFVFWIYKMLYSFQVMLAFDLKVRKLSKDK